jgi:hypothetical protein
MITAPLSCGVKLRIKLYGLAGYGGVGYVGNTNFLWIGTTYTNDVGTEGVDSIATASLYSSFAVDTVNAGSDV